jgi:hypothetical protein
MNEHSRDPQKDRLAKPLGETQVVHSGQPEQMAHARAASRCGAKTRRGTNCEAPAIKGGRRCRLHGGLSTGPRTPEGRERIRQARTIHGFYSAKAIATRRRARAGYRSLRAFLRELG